MSRLFALLCALLFVAACTPSQRAGIPVVSTVDAIGMGVSRVLGWCEEHDVPPSSIDAAREAAQRGDYAAAAAIAEDMLRDAGREEAVPADVVATLRLVQGALAAQAIDDAMSALSAKGE